MLFKKLTALTKGLDKFAHITYEHYVYVSYVLIYFLGFLGFFGPHDPHDIIITSSIIPPFLTSQ